MSVKRRGNRWVAVVYDPSKKRNRWVGTFPTQQDAKIAEGKAIEDARKRKAVSGTVEAFASRWLEVFPRPKRATNLDHGYQIKAFVNDFAQRELNSIGRAEAREWALKHKSSVHSARAMFTDAMRIDLCDYNPLADLRLPQSRGRKDLEVLSREEVVRLAEIARERFGPPFEAFILTAAFTGMRPGELYALRWPAVDFQNDEIRVLQQFSSTSREFTLPKNGLTRTIVMPPPAKTALLGLPRGDGLVFRSNRNLPMSGSSMHYYWDPVRSTAGYPAMHFYELRHHCASYMLNVLELPPQDVAHQLGHTDGGVLVMKLYGHPDARLARERIKRAYGQHVAPLRPVEEAG